MCANREQRTIKALERSLEIIDAVQELNGARVTELAEYLDYPASTVHSHLATLQQNEYLTKEGDVYHIGLKFLYLGGYAGCRTPGYRMAAEVVENVAAETEERAQFMIEEHGWAVYVYTATGDHAVQVHARVGRRTHPHASAAGKSILAHLPDHRVEEILESRPLTGFTENTITDREMLEAELQQIRERGYSFNKEESISGLCAVGVPVKGPDGRVIGGLSVSGPAHRMKGEWFTSEIPDLLLGSANELELNIAYS